MSVKIASLYAEITADTSKLQTGLKQSKAGLFDMKTALGAVGLAAGAMTTVIYTAGKAISATVGEYVKYASQVRTITQITGQSAEAVSRMIQVADDYKISTDQLTLAMKKLAGEGLELTTDSLARMSDEFLRLAPGVERQTYLTEKFGRQGQAFAEIMLAGGDAIREQAGAISDSLILTDAAIKRARDYEKSLDNVHDAAYGVKISMGQYILPALEDFLEYTNDAIAGWGEFIKYLQLTSQNTTNLNVLLDRMDKVRKKMAEAKDAGDLGTLTYANLEAELNALIIQYNLAASATNEVTQSTEELQEAAADLRTELAQQKTAWQLQYTSAQDAADKTKIAVDWMGEQLQGLGEDGSNVWNGFLAATGQISEEAIAQFIKIQVAMDNLERMIASKKFSIDFLINIAVQQVGIATGTQTTTSNATTSTDKPYTGGDPSQHRASGGGFTGWAMVGDAPGGGRTPYTEYVYAPHGAVVYNQRQMSGQSAPPMAGGGIMPPITGAGEVELTQRSINLLAEALSFKLQPYL